MKKFEASHETSIDVLASHRRWYTFPVYNSTSEAEIDEAFAFAREWRYQGLLFDLSREVTRSRELVVRSALATAAMQGRQEPILFRVAASEANEFLGFDPHGDAYWNFVLHMPMEEAQIDIVAHAARNPARHAVTLRFLPSADLARSQETIRTLVLNRGIKRIHLEFPFAEGPGAPELWKETEIQHWILSLQKACEGVELLPPLGWGLEDPELPNDELPYPKVDRVLSRCLNKDTAPEISVIIPTYERCVELMNTLRHLYRQRVGKNAFEIIVIDCGSHDSTLRDVENIVDSEGRGYQLTLVKLARPLRRRRGESHYRAAYARNIGAACARGRVLTFLDDDMLVPRDYLESLLDRFAPSRDSSLTVAMAKRTDLRDGVFGVRLAWDQIDLATDTAIRDRGFWRDFHDQAERWMEFKRPWRFLCSHSLTIEAKLFNEVGWFRENFVSYGFEDAELGRRLIQAGAKFELLPLVVYHQHRGPGQIVLSKSRGRKLRLLGRAAQVFWRHTLAQDVWEHCHYLFKRPLGMWLAFGEIRSGGPMWRFRRRKIS